MLHDNSYGHLFVFYSNVHSGNCVPRDGKLDPLEVVKLISGESISAGFGCDIGGKCVYQVAFEIVIGDFSASIRNSIAASSAAAFVLEIKIRYSET